MAPRSETNRGSHPGKVTGEILFVSNNPGGRFRPIADDRAGMHSSRMRQVLLATVAMILMGCSFLDEASRDEVAHANSPDGLTRAILFETNGGATTSFGYEIELRSATHQDEDPVAGGRLYGATRSGCSYGVNLRWLSPTVLALDFMEAKNLAVPTAATVGGKTITIVSRSRISDENAPCGGMLASRG